MTPVLAWLATYGVHSTLLLGSVALVTGLFVKRDAWRDTLWKAALLGGLVTATLQLALGTRPLVGRWELPVRGSGFETGGGGLDQCGLRIRAPNLEPRAARPESRAPNPEPRRNPTRH